MNYPDPRKPLLEELFPGLAILSVDHVVDARFLRRSMIPPERLRGEVIHHLEVCLFSEAGKWMKVTSQEEDLLVKFTGRIGVMSPETAREIRESVHRWTAENTRLFRENLRLREELLALRADFQGKVQETAAELLCGSLEFSGRR